MATTPFVNALVSGQLAANNNNPIYAATHQAPAAPSNNGYFWKGADGNVYVQGSKGINSAGAWDANTQNYWASRGYTMTAPSPTKSASTNNTGGGGGGGGYGSSSASSYGTGGGSPAVTYPDKSNDIAVNQAGLGSVGDTENTGIKAIEDAWAKINGQYNDDLNTASTEYGNESVENNKDLQINKQTALERGVQGRQGLFGTLASLGALNGTGIELANKAVAKGANEDLTTASNTYATNQNGLDSGYNAYTQQEKRLQSQAESAKNNDEQVVHNDAAKSRQTYLKNIGDDYQTMGNAAKAKEFYDQVAQLFPSIAATNVPTINLGYSGGAYTAPTLSQYVGKANNTTVQTTPGQAATPGSLFNIPGLVALNKKNT